jgi:Leucine-rich repeat (LRR) protein
MCSQLQLISKVNVSCRASIMHAIVVNCVVLQSRTDHKKCGLTTIPESIRHLKRLEWLSFVGNKLTTLPDIFEELPSLKSVDLRDNPLEALPPSLQHMTRPINVNL